MQPTKANVRAQGATIIGQMLVDGPQMRGQATAEARDAVSSAQRDAQDAIDRDEIPRQYQGAVQKYFEQLAGLLREGASATEKPADDGKPAAEGKPAPEDKPAADGRSAGDSKAGEEKK